MAEMNCGQGSGGNGEGQRGQKQAISSEIDATSDMERGTRATKGDAQHCQTSTSFKAAILVPTNTRKSQKIEEEHTTDKRKDSS